MKFPTLGEKTPKEVLKFEAKLLVAVGILVAVVYFGTNALIVKAADIVATAYTQGF